jgi:serine/threonine protein kinase/tetratricopeptide (TPR) repeat protein
MGRVYRVEDTKVKEEIALKLIKPEIAADKKTIERFRNELKIARKIRHKNVCAMFDLSEEKGSHYITMEYVSGGDLKKFIRRSGQMGIGKAISIAKQICDGLEEAHSLGIVHRDLKPNNIMIDDNGNARIMDFGIARSIKSKGITGSGVMIGTPEYMSPEQVEGKDSDQRSDIYSLGIILYEMLTGRLPFEGDTPFIIGVKHKSETPQNPKKFNPQITDDLNSVIMRCLEKERENRYQSAGELRSELNSIERGLPTTEIAVHEKKRQTSREVTISIDTKKVLRPVLIVLSALIILILAWQFFPRKKTPQAQKIENSIAVVSFENQTGKQELDYLQKMIPNLLITNLENTGLFYVATWERMSDLLRQTEKRDFDKIDSALGFKFCEQEGIESIVVGSYSQAGDVFVTDIKVLDVETRDLLKSASSTGEGIGSILKTQVNELSRTVAEGLGVAREKIDAVPLNIEDVATTSLEAYKAYLQGREAEKKLDNAQALKFYEKATDLDPNFAYAYRRQSAAHLSLGNSQSRRETLIKAKSLSRHATEKERLYIEAAYASVIENNDERMLQIYQQIADKYPKEKDVYYNFGLYYDSRSPEKAAEYYEKALELDPDYGSALNMLAYLYLSMDRKEEAVELHKRYVSLSPGNPNSLDSLADSYFHIGQLDEALDKYMEITETYPEFYSSNMCISYIHALEEDYTTALKWIDQYFFYAPSLVLKGRGLFFKSLCLSRLGRFEDALEELEVVTNLAEAAENGSLKGQAEWMKGCVYFDQREFGRSRVSFKNFFDSPEVDKPWRLLASICYGLLDIEQGIYDPAKSPLSQMESFLSEITTRKDFWVHQFDSFKAEVFLAEKHYDKAIDLLRTITIPEYLLYPQFMIFYNYPALKDVSARAYLGKGNIDEAIAEYKKLVTFDPDSQGRFLIHPKYHFRLAKLYQRKGEKMKAAEHFEKFLDLWKDADPGLPEVEDAKEALKRLPDLR